MLLKALIFSFFFALITEVARPSPADLTAASDSILIKKTEACQKLYQSGRFKEALVAGTDAYESSLKTGAAYYTGRVSELLSQIFEKTGDPDAAYRYYLISVAISDSLANISYKKEMNEREIAFRFEKKQLADSIQNAKKEAVQGALHLAQEAALKKEKNIFRVIVLGFILLMGAGFIVYNRLLVTNRQKKIIDIQKDEITQSYQKLDEKNKDIMASIKYAARIQRCLITSEKYISRYLNKK